MVVRRVRQVNNQWFAYLEASNKFWIPKAHIERFFLHPGSNATFLFRREAKGRQELLPVVLRFQGGDRCALATESGAGQFCQSLCYPYRGRSSLLSSKIGVKGEEYLRHRQ